jgi:hypothetical protein
MASIKVTILALALTTASAVALGENGQSSSPVTHASNLWKQMDDSAKFGYVLGFSNASENYQMVLRAEREGCNEETNARLLSFLEQNPLPHAVMSRWKSLIDEFYQDQHRRGAEPVYEVTDSLCGPLRRIGSPTEAKNNMEFCQVFERALAAALDDSRNGRFTFSSERDIQALIFHHAIVLAEQRGLPLKIHAEPPKCESKPDLVLGDDEVFVEIKLSKPGSGAYTDSREKWRQDISKLRRYKEASPSALCVFLAIDEAGYHSRPSSKNFFGPTREGLKGEWRQLKPDTCFLLAKI